MILVTGFTGKVGFEVAKKLKASDLPMICGVRNVSKEKDTYGDAYHYVHLDLSQPMTFSDALSGIKQIFLIYPPGDKIEFEEFLNCARKKGIRHIVYLSVKDVQFLPFIHHYKNEKLIRKSGISYTFIRAGYFMQNLNDFLSIEIKDRKRIFIPAGKGKTSFVDTRDLADVALTVFKNPDNHVNKKYVITGDNALDFFEVAEQMSHILHTKIIYTNPSVKEFKEFMLQRGESNDYINVIVGIHFPTKLGLAKGITHDYEEITQKKPTKMKTYIEDYWNRDN
ncbi:SDR family oxidoreductase [Fictibacillus sp. 5RED26]|uniref:SDR family oxidoreductase n=1 Tax=Fictibacillus sp. 5RED26 TaxID=2745876 RepID=UPI0018CC91D2|nr:SDR family oxidoreductase [Fictibacillus sp. 5RED26]MBH0158640.1 SDR family oxidoreductase [Fictibacillus sp. 5RED26]